MGKLVIFDCDGVLVDSQILLNRVDAEAFTAMGFPLSVDECIQLFSGKNEKTIHEMILQESGIDIPESYLSFKQQEALPSFDHQLYPLIEATLQTLATRQIPRCVASSSPKARVLRFLEISQQLQYFDPNSIFTAELVAKGKPHPDLFLYTAAQMQYDPEECIVIEDSFAGVQAAQAAQMPVIAFLGGTHAQSAWYREKMALYQVPMATTTNDLTAILMAHLSQ